MFTRYLEQSTQFLQEIVNENKNKASEESPDNKNYPKIL